METERTELPAPKSKEPFSIIKVIRGMVGKDLTKTCVPVQFNEPLSMLQKFAESMEYEDLLVRANKEQDPYIRCMLVAAFGVSRFSSTNNRLDKPFNPLLGETYELVDSRGKFKCISE